MDRPDSRPAGRPGKVGGMDDPLLDRHDEALDLFTDRVHAVRADQWGAPTPCAAWSVRDLVTGAQTRLLAMLGRGA